jgi:hypothetical protein
MKQTKPFLSEFIQLNYSFAYSGMDVSKYLGLKGRLIRLDLPANGMVE